MKNWVVHDAGRMISQFHPDESQFIIIKTLFPLNKAHGRHQTSIDNNKSNVINMKKWASSVETNEKIFALFPRSLFSFFLSVVNVYAMFFFFEGKIVCERIFSNFFFFLNWVEWGFFFFVLTCYWSVKVREGKKMRERCRWMSDREKELTWTLQIVFLFCYLPSRFVIYCCCGVYFVYLRFTVIKVSEGYVIKQWKGLSWEFIKLFNWIF